MLGGSIAHELSFFQPDFRSNWIFFFSLLAMGVPMTLRGLQREDHRGESNHAISADFYGFFFYHRLPASCFG